MGEIEIINKLLTRGLIARLKLQSLRIIGLPTFPSTFLRNSDALRSFLCSSSTCPGALVPRTPLCQMALGIASTHVASFFLLRTTTSITAVRRRHFYITRSLHYTAA